MSLLDFRMQLRNEEAAKTVGTRHDQLAPLNKADIGKLHAGSASFHQNSSTIMETENSDSGMPASPTNRHKFDILTISNPSIRTPQRSHLQQDVQGWLSAKSKMQNLN